MHGRIVETTFDADEWFDNRMARQFSNRENNFDLFLLSLLTFILGHGNESMWYSVHAMAFPCPYFSRILRNFSNRSSSDEFSFQSESKIRWMMKGDELETHIRADKKE